MPNRLVPDEFAGGSVMEAYERAPSVSVVLPVYNGVAHLRESIQSILVQSHSDFELVIVDDASSDDSLAVVREFDDPRIVVVALSENLGLAEALNVGITTARAGLIARQDQDDLSAQSRLADQVAFLSEHPDVVLLGTWATIISSVSDGTWRVVGAHRHPTGDAELRMRLLWNNPFVHSSVMFRRTAFDRAGGYGDPAVSWPEDYDLWSRMARHGVLANLPSELLTYRQTPGGMSEEFRSRIASGVVTIASENLRRAVDGDTPQDLCRDIARALNSMPDVPVALREALDRARLFQKAIISSSGFSVALVVPRARWTAKLLARSLRPRHGSLDTDEVRGG